MTVRYFDYRDTGAPTLTGQVGSLTTLLDACLVNGYNSQTVTSVTRSGSVVTVTKTAHGFRDGASVIHSGANESEYNIEAYITRVDANTYTYPIATTPASPATGTVTAKVGGAGWGIAYTGTNKRAYRAASGNRHYLRIEDNNGHAQGAQYAGWRGYVAMSDIDTGTEAFPTPAQRTDAQTLCLKSAAADSTTRPWVVVADEKRFHLWVGTNNTVAAVAGYPQSIGTTACYAYFFGEIKSFKSGDAYNTLSIANYTTGAASELGTVSATVATPGAGVGNSGHYMARSYLQTGTSHPATKIGGYERTGIQYMGVSSYSGFPDLITGAMVFSPVHVAENQSANYTYAVRGSLPGIWNPLHNFPLGCGDIVTGSGETSGKKYLLLNVVGGGNNVGRAAYEISNTWDV